MSESAEAKTNGLGANTQVKDLMTRDVRMVHPQALTKFAIQSMAQHAVRHLIVSDDCESVTGLFSQRDLLKHLASRFSDGENPGRDEVANFMTTNVTTISGTALVSDAARIMNDRRIGCLPVVDDRNQLAGILTRSDLLSTMHSQNGNVSTAS